MYGGIRKANKKSRSLKRKLTSMESTKEQTETLTATRNQAFKVENYKKDGDDISFDLVGGLLVPDGGNIVISGNTIGGLTDNEITSIEVKTINGEVYKYELLVVGSTDWFDSWSWNFTDLTGDTYGLGIDSPVSENHYVDYNSDNPIICKISAKQS